MMELESEDIVRLSRIFDNTTATYKYYWMLSLLDIVRRGRGHQPVSYTEMVARMVSKAWQPLMIGRFGFGKCDALLDRVKEMIVHSPLNINSYEDRVYCYIMANKDSGLVKEIVVKLTKYVPARFLYPWIGTCTNSEAYIMSSAEERRCLYSIDGKYVYLNPLWIKYLAEQNYILECFAYHRLNCFLEQRNPDFILPAESSFVTTADEVHLSYSDTYKRYFVQSSIVQTKQKKISRTIKNVYNFYQGSQNVGTIVNQSNKHDHGRK